MESKFNIGDRVRVSLLSHEYGGKYIGEVGVVKMVMYNDSYGVKLNGHWNYNSTMGYFWFNSQSLVPREKPKEEINKKEILVGDMKTGYSFISAKEAEELRMKMELDRALKGVEDLTKSCTFINEKAYIPLHIEKVIFNNPATIVMWSDGTKTIVKCDCNEAFDEEKGLAMAISKKVLGNKGNYYNEFKKWLPEKEEFDDRVSMEEVTESFRNFGKALRKFKGDEKI